MNQIWTNRQPVTLLWDKGHCQHKFWKNDLHWSLELVSEDFGKSKCSANDTSNPSHTVAYCHIQPTCVIVYNDLYVQTTSSSLVFETSKRKHLIKSQLVSVINSCQNPKHNNHQLMGGHHSTGQIRLLQVMPGRQDLNDWLLTKKKLLAQKHRMTGYVWTSARDNIQSARYHDIYHIYIYMMSKYYIIFDIQYLNNMTNKNIHQK